MTQTKSLQTTKTTSSVGDIITLEYYSLTPENGFIPEPLFDLDGVNVPLILGWGNYLPGLHEILLGKGEGEVVNNISIDAGWGNHRMDLVFPDVSFDMLLRTGIAESKIRLGEVLPLKAGLQVTISSIDENMKTVILDANHPLAGSSYSFSCKIHSITSLNTEKVLKSDRYQVATFALGCFWGAELAFMRTPGVVGTRVGFSQGHQSFENPSYKEVCEGTVNHREVVQVVYDSYQIQHLDLAKVAISRLYETKSPLTHHLFDSNENKSNQYRYAFIFHNNNQRQSSIKLIDENDHLGIDLLPAKKVWLAEEYHQKYLYKGGQNARKGIKERIRCFG
jgi:peptide-methionine (S)-S-oxide reductase